MIRIGVEYWPPLLLAGVRFVIAGSLMYAWLRWRGAPAPSWAFGSVWSKYLPLPQGAMASAVEMLVGGVVLLIGSALSGEHLQAMPPLEGWLALAYLIFFGSIIAFNSYMYLLKHVRPAAATSYAYVNPAVAVLLGVVFVGETIDIEEALAMLVIISAVLLISLPQWRRPAQPPVEEAKAVPTEARTN